MEELNKTQIVLVCLLLSFVTSIGTGIITVSLLQEAPQSVTQTINRVVERTVEKVVPQQGPSNTVTREVTVVVKEEDLVIDAINKNSKSLVRIFRNDLSTPTFVAIGLVISADGTIISDERSFSTQSSYSAVFSDGKTLPLKIANASLKTNALFFTATRDQASYVFYPAVIGNSDMLQLGQTVMALGGKDRNAVATGRITDLTTETVALASSTSSATSTKQVTRIETDALAKDGVVGTLLINLNGEVVGLHFPNPNQNETIYVPIEVLRFADPNSFGLPKKNSP